MGSKSSLSKDVPASLMKIKEPPNVSRGGLRPLTNSFVDSPAASAAV
ncbi:hypothetical protein JRI60_14975 [Archangium violaceum]|nr:hypothetical protein [Archangium violaceum]QRO00225.1 hypothetical protein JRI60_14975 [Archangium violaceum]